MHTKYSSISVRVVLEGIEKTVEMLEVRKSEWLLLWAILGDNLRIEDEDYIYLRDDLVAYVDGSTHYYLSRKMYTALQEAKKEIERLSNDKVH